ncbi:MAG: hypothetical protein JEZ00_06155 [Anaerolineaceae bacterium]|nr:hypothetical protein [Anaerolineaceae bacterium]
MNLDNPVINLCQQGAEDEYHGKLDQACMKYHRAWDIAQDDYDACIAAHYMARCQKSDQEILHWNLVALMHANQCIDERIAHFWGSLYVNLGQSYENLGEQQEAKLYFKRAADHGIQH